MKGRAPLAFALFAGLSSVLLAVASNAQSGAGQSAANLRIYGPGELSVSQYEVVGRPWIDSWRTAKRPVEAHLYEHGGHGFGMMGRRPAAKLWIDEFYAWMADRGLLKH